MILSSHIVSLDLEHGTYRLAWTQTITSGRWVPVKPGPPVVAALLASGALIPRAAASLTVAFVVYQPADRVRRVVNVHARRVGDARAYPR